MDRILKVYAKTGHLFAEFKFYYDQPRQVSAYYTQYSPLDIEGPDDIKSVIPLMRGELYVNYREFASIEEIKAHDVQLVQKELGRDMDKPEDYTYEYPEHITMHRYVAQNHIGCIGLIDIRFNFISNIKELKFMSGADPRFDHELSSGSLE